MNQYSWETMANDYTYLEELGRKAAEWGLDIVKGGYMTSAISARRARGRGRERRGLKEGRSGVAKEGGRGKRECLRMQLDSRDVDMEILPLGMERRQLNQSTWVAKWVVLFFPFLCSSYSDRSRSILMTIEFVFHMVKDALAPRNAPEPPSFTLLTHRNSLDAIISDVVRRHIRDRGKKSDIPTWVQWYFSSETDNAQLVYLMNQPANSPSNPASKVYHKLDSAQSLLTALRNKMFIEYPTIDIWEEGDFTGSLVEADGVYVEGEELRPAKRRRLDAVGGRQVINNLLGGYTSNEETDDVMGMLGNYLSDEESSSEIVAAEVNQDTEDVDDAEEPTLEDISDMLEGVGDDLFAGDQMPLEEDVKEDSDWGNSSDDEAEKFVRELERRAASRQA